MHDDDTLVHRGEDKAIINGCTDGEKKSYCFENSCPGGVSEHQGSELCLNSNKQFNNNNNAEIKGHQLQMKGGKMHVYI